MIHHLRPSLQFKPITEACAKPTTAGNKLHNLVIPASIGGGLLALLLAVGTLPAAGQMATASNGKFVGNVLSTTDTVFDTYWNQATPENAGKWGSVEGTRDVMNWTQLDYMYAYTRDTLAPRGIPFKQHTFVWGQQYPAWITTLTQAEQREEVEEWIAAFAARYPDTEFIDVVNEPLPGHAPPPYAAALGGAGVTGWDWVIWSFEKARQYLPNAKLLINDYSIISSDSATTQYLTIINLLKDRGLIDGIGEQAHFFETTPITTIQNNLNRLAATGLPIYISELDINLANDSAQSNRYQTLFPVFWTNPAVRGITFWGYKQGEIWREDGYLLRSDGSERPAMTWLKNYIAANPQSFSASVTAPANGQGVSSLSPVSATATVTYGKAPFTVTFQKKLNTETEFTPVSSDNSPPYTAELGILPPGTYQIRAIVTDNVAASVTSATNTFTVSQIQAADGTWLGNSGAWSDTTNNPTSVWSGGTPADLIDSTAYFTGVDIAADRTITISDVARTIGNITFTDATNPSNNLTISGANILTLDRTSGAPVINVTQAGRTLAISSVIAGSDGLQKNGEGTLKLASANTFTGGLTINAGTAFVDTATGINALSSGKVTIGDVANTGASAELLFTATGNFPSFGNLIDIRGNGTATLRVIGYNPAFSGAVNMGNNLTVISNNNFGSTIGFSGGVTGTGNLVIQSNAANAGASSAITFSGSTLNFTGSITNSGTTTSTTASNTTISAVIGSNVTGITQNSTNSQLILTGNNTFTGNILVSSGILQANRVSSGAAPTSGALGNAQASGRTATISSGGTLRFVTNDVMGDGGSSPKLTLIANGGTILNGGNFINSLGPVQLNGGTLNSSGTSTGFKLTGTITVAGSAVSTISSGGNIGSGGVITYDVADAVAGSGNDLNVTAVLADVFGTGGIIKTGAGTMTLASTNTFTGITRIDNGTLALGASGSIATSASVTIKAGATLNTSAKPTYTVPTGKPVNFNIDATGSGSTGKISAAGLNVSNATVTYDITGPLNDAAYVLATYSSLTGTFLSAPSNPVGYTLNYAYEGNKIALVSTSGNITPAISDILNPPSFPSGGNTGPLAFTVTDEDVNSVSPAGSSDNITLVPSGNIVFGGSGASRTVTVTPVSGKRGTATITVTLTDNGSLTTADTFVLTVTDNYLSWATDTSVTGGENGDSDNDGVKNLVEYALVDGGERGVLSGNTMTFTKRGGVYGSDLTYIIQTSETLDTGSWSDAVTQGPGMLISNPAISYTFTPGTPVKKFARLKITNP